MRGRRATRPGPPLLIDARWDGPHGIGRFSKNVREGLGEIGSCTLRSGPDPTHPLDCLWVSYQLWRRRPGLYFTPGFTPPWRTQVPFVFAIHDLVHLKCPVESDWKKRLYYRWIVLPAAKRARFILTPSNFSKAAIIDWARVPAARVVVTGNAAGPEFEPEGPRADPGYPYIFAVASGKPHKNRRRLVQAFQLSGLRSDGFHIVFTGERSADVDGLVPDGIHFLGTVADDQLPNWYRGARMTAFLSLYEGFGIPLLESMACGVPVITSNTTSPPEVVGDAALCVDPLDVRAIAAAIGMLHRDHELREALRERGLRRAGQFTWKICAEKVAAALAAASSPTAKSGADPKSETEVGDGG